MPKYLVMNSAYGSNDIGIMTATDKMEAMIKFTENFKDEYGNYQTYGFFIDPFDKEENEPENVRKAIIKYLTEGEGFHYMEAYPIDDNIDNHILEHNSESGYIFKRIGE